MNIASATPPPGAMKIGLAAARETERAALRRLAEGAGMEIAWVATTAPEVLVRGAGAPLVMVAHGELDAAACARDLAGKGVKVVVAVTDTRASVDALYDAIARGGVEVAPLSDVVALGSILARHARGARPSVAPARAIHAPVFAVSASAGGPDALAAVLSGLSTDPPLRVIVAQHIEAPFTAGLASWLASRTGRRVEVADEGRALASDVTLVVRSDRQPIVDAAGVVRYQAHDPKNPFHPCIDTLLTSLAKASALRGAAALLTGMGEDGARGLLALREAGWVTIAQDAESSAVFGMPRAAAALGAARHVVPLDRIGATASRVLRGEIGART